MFKPGHTKALDPISSREAEMQQVLTTVHKAMQEKGYPSIHQIANYIISDDPAYITSHNDARSLICRYDRHDLLHAIVSDYLSNN